MRTLSTIPERATAPTSHRGTMHALRSLPRTRRNVRRLHSVDASGLGERWLTKQELAAYLRVTPRFIELQQHVGLPVLRIGAVNRYRISEVESWLREQYTSGTGVRSA